MENENLKNPDGTWKYNNKLGASISPYLLRHAHNPVNWYPWGDEALELAKKQDKMIFVSIGYSSCYWCHVMERDVFHNERICSILNEHFISIKIDREERPDLDEILSIAREYLTTESGWPNNLFLTPELKPFFAGGTFSNDHRYGNTSFEELLIKTIYSWQHNKAAIQQTSLEVMEYIDKSLSKKKGHLSQDIILDESHIKNLSYQLISSCDVKNGGFDKAPKFPHEVYINFLLQNYDSNSAKIAFYSLDKMAASTLFDHVNGGFHRYCIDEEWKVPHFEKMLYTQAQLALCYLEAYKLSGKQFYAYITRKILDFVISDLMDEKGGFYSAIDAEIDEVEGTYYAWDEQEINQILTPQEQSLFYNNYALIDVDRFVHYKHASVKIIHALDYPSQQQNYLLLEGILTKFKNICSIRKMPRLDDKVITAWHGMMIKAFASAGEILQDKEYTVIATNAAIFLEQNLFNNNQELLRISCKRIAQPGFLEDYAYSISGLLRLHQTTNMPKWLDMAKNLIQKCEELFKDEQTGAYFFNQKTSDSLAYIKNADDSSTPSANSVMLHNMIRMALITNDKSWISNKGDEILNCYALEMATEPINYCHLIHGLLLKMQAEEVLNYVKFIHSKAPKSVKIGQEFEITIKLEIKENYHIYGHDIDNNKYYPSKIEFIAPNNSYLKVKEIVYPAGEKYKGFKIYSNKISIITRLEFTSGANILDFNEQININFYFQACNNLSCFKPDIIRYKLCPDIIPDGTNDNCKSKVKEKI
jgi:uncharacterized protein YyaL (SSP411 family)